MSWKGILITAVIALVVVEVYVYHVRPRVLPP